MVSARPGAGLSGFVSCIFDVVGDGEDVSFAAAAAAAAAVTSDEPAIFGGGPGGGENVWVAARAGLVVMG